PDESSRRFWAVAIGVILEGYAMGRSPEQLCGEMLRVLGDQATTTTSGDNTRLRLVGDRDESDSDSPDGEGSS
ncbi:MAG TPA: TetR/AcrR family transcriptional regulator C-terminal domain-containing protein, partial [Dongiaceae bacterium]